MRFHKGLCLIVFVNFSMVGAFTLLLAMLIPQYPLPNVTSSAAELLYHLFLAFTMSTFIYITFLEIINQTLLWLAPLQSIALANALYLGLHQAPVPEVVLLPIGVPAPGMGDYQP